MKTWFHQMGVRSLLLASTYLAGSCGPIVENVPDSQILIVVTVKGIQSGTQSLQIASSLNGKADPAGLSITNNTSKFAITLARDPKNYGQLKIDGYAMDTNQCYLANGQVTEQITDQKTFYELDLTLLPQASPKCGLSVKVTGNGTVTSTPAGINCGGGQTVCSYDFPFGTDVTLSGPVGLTSYPVWTAGCTPSATYYAPTCATKVQKGGSSATVDFVPRVCSPDGWCQYHPLGSVQALYDVWGSGPSALWSVGAGSTILGSSGGAWLPPTSNPIQPNSTVYYVKGTAADNVYATGFGNAGLSRWDGTKWTMQPNWPGYPNVDARGLFVVGPSDVMIPVADFSGPTKYLIYRFNGTTYTSLPITLVAGEALYRIWGVSGSDAWVGSSTGIYHWDGTKWTKDASPAVQNKSLQFVWGTAANDIYAATPNELFHYDGTAWTAAPPDNGVTPANFLNLGGAKGPEVWMPTGTNGRFFRYAGGACSPKCWTQVDVPNVPASFRAVWGAANDNLWAVGNSGIILHYNGTQWTRSPYTKANLTTNSLTASYGVPNNQNSALQIFGPVDTALNTDNNNIIPATGFSTTAQSVQGAYGLNANEIMVVGSNGLVLRYDGTSWKSIPSGTSNTLYGVYINNSPRYYYIVGTGGFIARADQTLTGFTPQTKNVPPAPNPNTTTQSFYSVGGSSYGNLFATSYSGVVYRTNDGVTWNQMLPIPNGETYYSAYYHPGTGRTYIGGTGGNLWYYSGAPFTQVTTASTAAIYTMWAMPGSQAMWLGGSGGTVLKFDGTNITAQKTSTTSSIRTIWGNNLTDVWAAGDSGTILRWKM